MFYRRFGFRRLHRGGREVDVDIWGFLACLSISIIRLHETLYPPFVEAELSFSSFSLPQISVVWALEQSRKELAGARGADDCNALTWIDGRNVFEDGNFGLVGVAGRDDLSGF